MPKQHSRTRLYTPHHDPDSSRNPSHIRRVTGNQMAPLVPDQRGPALPPVPHHPRSQMRRLVPVAHNVQRGNIQRLPGDGALPGPRVEPRCIPESEVLVRHVAAHHEHGEPERVARPAPLLQAHQVAACQAAALRVAQDAVKGALVGDDLVEILEGVAGGGEEGGRVAGAVYPFVEGAVEDGRHGVVGFRLKEAVDADEGHGVVVGEFATQGFWVVLVDGVRGGDGGVGTELPLENLGGSAVQMAGLGGAYLAAGFAAVKT